MTRDENDDDFSTLQEKSTQRVQPTRTEFSVTTACESSSSSTCSDADAVQSIPFLLSSEDRYDVWIVKAKERPHLLREERQISVDETLSKNEIPNEDENMYFSIEQQQGDDKNDTNINDEDDDDQRSVVLPLLDGCDIPGWRRSKLIPVSDYVQGNLNVGSGCSLLRRESQLPLLSSQSRSKWNALKQRLMEVDGYDTDATNNSVNKKKIPRLSVKDPAVSTISPWFERDNVPVLLEPSCISHWKALESCTWDQLVQRFGHHEWRFSDTHGACMLLSTYTKYVHSLEGETDDAPLAVYDSQFGNDNDDDDDGEDLRCQILDEYCVPPCFDGPDLFECLEEPKDRKHGGANKLNDSSCCINQPHRPPYRWILMGPARSGTGLHVDPMGTHAWVTLLQGLKRWVLFPFGTDPKSIRMQEPQIPSVLWFANFHERVMKEYGHVAVELVQKPGETVYVPAGWPHLVLNLESTVAITHNYATEYPSIERLIHAVREEEPELESIWLHKLEHTRPDLVRLLQNK